MEGFLRGLEALRDTVETGGGDPACPFVLSTIHASKGLEYDRVFLIDAVDGIFPSVNPGRETTCPTRSGRPWRRSGGSSTWGPPGPAAACSAHL